MAWNTIPYPNGSSKKNKPNTEGTGDNDKGKNK